MVVYSSPFKTVAIVGRPNVGKSTLFNRLTGKRHALVDDQPGVTRDRREGEAKLASLQFKVIDTAGLEEAHPDALGARMLQQTEVAVTQADVCLFLMDGRAGVTAEDTFFAKWLRKKNVPVILVVNKCEGYRGEEGFDEALRLGFKPTIAISAEHGEGMALLYEVLAPYVDQEEDNEEDEDKATHPGVDAGKEEGEEEKHALQIAIIGRPNVGKSTLMNRLLQEERVLTGPEAGITRDAIAIDWEYKGHPIRLIDTAGVRRRANVTGKVEKLAVSDTLRAIRFAQVVIVLLDATQAFEKQDMAIADMVIKEGRALVVVLNKWDKLSEEEREKVLEEVRYTIDHTFSLVEGAEIVPLSALYDTRIEQIIDAALKTYQSWNARVTTGILNEWLKYAISRHLPPLGKNNRKIHVKYATQTKTRPPTFALFANRSQDVPEHYTRYLIRSLRERFNLPGIPIRMIWRSTKNPYQK